MSSASTTADAGLESAAVRRIIYGLAELDGEVLSPDETPLVEAAGKAVENLERLADAVDDLEGGLEELEQRAPDPSKQSYDQMDRGDKATVVRSKLRKEASATTGKSMATYKDIVRMFDGYPSAGHAYDIMETAAEGDGFDLGTSPEGTKRLTYDERRCEQ